MILLNCLATWCGGLTGKQDTIPLTVAKDLVLERAASPRSPYQASPISSPAGSLAPAGDVHMLFFCQEHPSTDFSCSYIYIIFKPVQQNELMATATYNLAS